MTGAFFHHEVLNGTAEIVAASTVVWYLVYLRRLLDGPNIAMGFILGFWAGVSTALSAYNPFFLLVVTLCELLHRLTYDPNFYCGIDQVWCSIDASLCRRIPVAGFT